MNRFLAVLLTATSVAASAQSFAGAPVIAVGLADYKFEPPAIALRAGRPIVLRLSNTASQPHEFAAPEFFRAAIIRPADARLINKEGEAEVAPGKRVEIALVPRAGTYHLQCNKPGHLSLGMHGSIVVK